MKTKLIQIGNSRGVRLPKPLIREAGLDNEVDISLRRGEIVIRAIGRPRSGWATAAKRLHDQDADSLLDNETPTAFDNKEWQW
jgi:antitoxin MazE